MVGHLPALLLMTMTVSAMQLVPSQVVSPQDHTVSFNEDVFPILQRNCQVCHRPGEVAPMSFLTYESTRPWAKAIKEAVLSKRMPPWFADPRYGGFRNKPTLTETEIKALAAWANSGAAEGDAKDKPVPVDWPERWRTKPDVIISIPEPRPIAAKGSGEIRSFLVPNPFRQDTWVSSIEIHPTEPSVVHHVMVQVPEDTPKPSLFSWGAPSASACIPLAVNTLTAQLTKAPKNFAILEAVYVPGSPVTDFQFHDSAKLIPGGGNLRIEVHYTPNGKATSDQTRIGFTIARKPSQRRFVTLAPKSFANP